MEDKTLTPLTKAYSPKKSKTNSDSCFGYESNGGCCIASRF